jgi:hypothetical protein
MIKVIKRQGKCVLLFRIARYRQICALLHIQIDKFKTFKNKFFNFYYFIEIPLNYIYFYEYNFLYNQKFKFWNNLEIIVALIIH